VFVQMKSITVAEGYVGKIVEQFASKGLIEGQPGFIDLSVLRKKKRGGNEEVIVMIRWESEEAWKSWETSEVHLAGHKENRKKLPPSYIIEKRQDVYHVLATKM